MNINIHGHIYTIDFVDGLFVNEGQWGKISNPSLLIEVDADLKPSLSGETILHEIMESLNFWQNWNLDHHLLTQINSSYYGVLNSNKHLIPKLFGETL